MRRKSLRTLSLALSAVMVLSVANPGVTAMATEADSVIEQQMETDVSEEAVVENDAEDVAGAATESDMEEVSEEITTEEVSEEAATEAVMEEATETTTELTVMENNTEAAVVATEAAASEEAVAEETTQEKELTPEVEEVEEAQKATVDRTKLLKDVITNATLLQMVVDIYNDTVTTPVTVDTMTAGNLQDYQGELIFEPDTAQVNAVTSLKGLGNAQKATMIDVSQFTKVTAIEESEFSECAFTTFKMPVSISSIGQRAFYGCPKLAAIYTGDEENTLPEGLISVGERAFMSNEALTAITIPTLTDESAVGLFQQCANLQTVVLGDGVTKIPMSAFQAVANGEESAGLQVTFGKNLIKIIDSAFKDTTFAETSGVIDLSSCTVLNGIASDAFRNTKNVNTVILPANNATLEFGDYAFANTSLTSMYPEGQSQTGIYMPDYTSPVMGIGVFSGNTGMTQVSLPASLKEVPDYTFDGCSALEIVEQRKMNNNCNVELIGDCAFRGTAITNTDFLLQMNKLVQIGRQIHTMTDNIQGATSRVMRVNFIPAGGVNDGYFDTADATNKKYRNYPVGSDVFTDCTKLTTVTIPATVQVLANRAFYMKSNSNPVLASVEWKSAAAGIAGVTRKIAPEAFAGNTALTTVVLPNNQGESLEIGKAAFCDNLRLATIGAAGVTDNTLPDTVLSIGEAAFYKCTSLEEVHIQAYRGNTMPALSPRTFEYCWRLKEATLPVQTTEIPYHFFAVCPLTSFNFTEMTELATIDTLAFVGHQFETVDLSACRKLEELGAASLAFNDSIANNYGSPDFDNVGYNIEINSNEKRSDAGATVPVLTTVVLPQSITSDGLFIDSGVFDSQSDFDTLYKAGSMQADTVVIPSYVTPGSNNQMSQSQGVFCATGVSKVIWEADTDPAAVTNRWKSIANNVYAGCNNIADVRDVLPKYVEKIGQAAFYKSSIWKADLSEYSNLKEISVVIGTAQQYGTFQECPNLTEVVLPSSVAEGITLNQKAFWQCPSLQTVDLGSAATIGSSVFENCTALESIDLKNVAKVDIAAFKGCSSLATMQFGSALQTIGSNAFESCKVLDLKDSPLPGTLVTIGSFAFKDSGITEIDFSKATALTTINNNAFENTKLIEFNISGTQVKVIPQSMLSGCSALQKASFGKEIEYISIYALAKCPEFLTFEFYSTTTVHPGVFQGTQSDTVFTGQNNAATTNSADITINVNVKTPAEVAIPVGRETEFPYYINTAGTSRIQYISIIDNNAKEDLTVEDALYIRAKTGGYYKVQNSDEENGKYKVNEIYYEKLSTAETITRSNNQKVDVIKVTGLKESGNRQLEFNIYADIQFTSGKNGISIKSAPFNAKYNVKVLNPKTTVSLYTDRTKSTEITSAYNIQAKDYARGAFDCYYDLRDMVASDVAISNYNITVETSDPSVLCVGANSAAKLSSYTTVATNIYGQTYDTNKRFYICPQKMGTASITVYPLDENGVKMEQYKKIYTFTINSDIQSILLAVPNEYIGKVNPGAKFSVFRSYNNYFNQTCTVDEMINFSKYSNRKIVFTSSDPDYVSVDSLGTVTILKADQAAKVVTITATADTADKGRVVKATVSLSVSYPAIRANEEMKDTKTGAKIAVTRISNKDLEGEVKFIKPANSKATSVTIPDTVVINGLKYKVTSIDKNAFKNNKKLKTVKVGKYVTTIGESAFSGCKALTKVTLPKSLLRIEKKAFYNCKKLKTVSISSSAKLTDIGDSAFQGCAKLTKITLPKKVQRIGAKAFYNCKKLKTITIKSSVLIYVGVDALKGIHKKATIKVPKKQLATYKNLLKGKGQKSTVKIKKG